jgi:Adenine specific DNA methylase Mod
MQRLELTWIGKGNEPAVEPRILLHDASKDYGDPDTDNMLIHGDNLLALKALEQEFAGRVKCIYIDPPYNTGSAFEHYDDNLEHSIWLELMYSRLLLLKNLLSDDGFFCCQIDDSEGHYLKAMLDEIYGRSNYLATFYIQVRYPNKTLAEDSDYQKIIEQCHIYAKQKYLAKLNRPQAEYEIDKFKWQVIEIEPGEKLTLGNKQVEIF